MANYLIRSIRPILSQRHQLLPHLSVISVKYSQEKPNKLPEPVTTASRTGKYSKENVRKNVKRYAFKRFMDYMTNYDKVLEKRFPSAVKVYRVFMVGVKEFYGDMKRFLKITRIFNNSAVGMRALTRQEIEVYYQMPKDMVKVAPVLLISTLPFANYVIFPLAYMYPRYFLSSHFWTLQQKAEFLQLYLKDRITYNRKVFRCLQAKLDVLKGIDYQKMAHILGLLGSGLHPSTDEIIDVKHVFEQPPFNLGSLTSKHVKYLGRLHDIGRGPWKRVRLTERSHIFHHMDLAIKREGGVHNMNTDALKHACYLRGLNPTNLSNESMVEWLREWVKISIKVDASNVSLFLHLPILIAYNHPNNWQLTHK